jgi:lipoprotein-anchoring transpeptidase ErfK/SrfK
MSGRSTPLADPETLSLLMANKPLPPPKDETGAIFHGQPVIAPPVKELSDVSRVLGDATDADQKRIEVDLTNQKVYAFDGDKKVHEFIVSTGKWGRTPTGEFRIWTKVKSTRMSGGNPADGTYYNLPNVPWVMFFANDQVSKSTGFSFHGTYWHHNFGHPMSHGCVNLESADAKTLFEWATPTVSNDKAWSTPATDDNPGTRVIIYGTPPEE